MSDLKDSAIKLFGKTIPLPINLQLVDVYTANESCSGEVPSHNNSPAFQKNKSEREREEQEGNMECSGKEIANDQHVDNSNQTNEESIDVTTSSGIIGENHKTPSAEGEISSQKDFKNGEQSESSVSQEKTLKKPDKILPCPRCNSMDTKFCYYNNYNVNQPRHFCKNCQRYWTAGGTMRNVPVGAGRRKNKSSSASHYHQIMISEALRTVQANAANGIQGPTLVNNGTVLTFGTDSPLCESVASVLNLSEKARNGVRNRYDRPEPRNHMSHGGSTYNGDDSSSGPTVTGNLNSSEKGSNGGAQESVKTIQGIPTPPPPQIPCFLGHPWPYPWTSAMPPPTFSPSGFPVSFYPVTNFWGCTVPNLWNVPPCPPPSSSSSLTPFAPISSPTSPLGKHSRDGNILNWDKPSTDRITSERGVLVPKTLRIDDPSEAAKSSIWTTLGIKSEKSNSFNGGGLFKGFQSKSQDKNYIAETSPLLQANPAALSRSLNFHERT